jgi:hypothetical protein
MSQMGQNPNPSSALARQLSPAADKSPHMFCSVECHERAFALRKNSEPFRRRTAVKSVTDLEFEACYPAPCSSGHDPVADGSNGNRHRKTSIHTALGCAAFAWPLAARAQQAMPVIGYIGTGSRESDAFRLPSFHQGLSETGYVEGRNVVIEYRWAEGQNDRFPALAADLVRRQVTVIAVPASTPGALAAKAATTTIPIVFYIGLDPVELGLVASLAHPGGNITGVTGWNVMVGPKRLELLHETVPTATSMALLVNPTSPNLAEADAREQQAAARILGQSAADPASRRRRGH